ncbi:hypothetical protein AS156_05515 [Bradyrhizobium macuxiense]|uniref:Uncharacterized protein n=1 Tax=Bradyrhizobium macuxiense TaxID=1755647 RepID=A0A109JV79_9BRAD|nr:hypothetical protein [Bradyrhizobium macuxiense]KWV55514.1 hypothetical protein AS156_05515 [Bradyrhizobium macuxiense]
MKKILLGLVAVIVIAIGGFFGFDLYTQRRITSAVEAVFDQVRAEGGTASHGRISFDLMQRTLTIGDIAIDTGTQPPFRLKAATVMAYGVDRSDTSRFSAGSLEARDVEIDATMGEKQAFTLNYKLPQVTVKDFIGPTGVRQLRKSASLFDLYGFGLVYLAGVSATSITAPSLTGTIKVATPGAEGSGGEYTYSNLVLDNIKDGKITSSRSDGVVYIFNSQAAGKAVKMTGNLANVVASDIDIGAMAAIFDPGKSDDARDYRVYRHVSAGPYEVTSTRGMKMRIEGITVDDVGFRPSQMQLPALLAMIPPPGSPPPSPAQARELMDRLASLYQGIRIGNAEMHGLSIETPQGPLKLASTRFNLDGGKIGELAIEGLDARAPKGPIKVGRFALKSLDVANFVRLSAQFAAQKPSPEQALALFPLLEGVEVKDFASPYKATGKPVNIDVFSLDWGQFVGSIPSKLRLIAKMAAPLDAADPRQQALVAAGINPMAIDADLGAAWTEASRSFALEPVKLDIAGLLNASAKVSLANVPREAFSASAAEAMGAAAQIEAGTIELTVHDLGVIDIAIAQYARTQNVSRDEARNAILNSIKAQGDASGGADPDATALVTAISQFIETPGQTLVIKLTPRAKAPALQLMQLLKTDPPSALAQFKIEASTGL